MLPSTLSPASDLPLFRQLASFLLNEETKLFSALATTYNLFNQPISQPSATNVNCKRLKSQRLGLLSLSSVFRVALVSLRKLAS